MPQQALVSTAKIPVSYVKCAHINYLLARHSKSTLELVRKIKRYRTLNVVTDSFSILMINVMLSPSPNTSFISTSASSIEQAESNPYENPQRDTDQIQAIKKKR